MDLLQDKEPAFVGGIGSPDYTKPRIFLNTNFHVDSMFSNISGGQTDYTERDRVGAMNRYTHGWESEMGQRMPWVNSNPLIRLVCAVRSFTRRSRSRCERRKSSSSRLGILTSEQTWRSPRRYAITVRKIASTSIRSVLTRRARRSTCILAESTTRQSIPWLPSSRASQKPS